MGNDSASTLINIGLLPNWIIRAEIAPILWIGLIVFLVAIIIYRTTTRGSLFGRDYEIDSAELGLGDSKLTLRPNMDDKAVAYKIWIELSTRKIGLPIDFDHDVISEVYDSWYSFFEVTRELIKDIPVSKVRGASTKQIIQLSIDVLNKGLRPHLTTWQARFRRWYDYKLSTDPEATLDPQDAQKDFPRYPELVADMRTVNDRLIKYREKMELLIHA